MPGVLKRKRQALPGRDKFIKEPEAEAFLKGSFYLSRPKE